VRAILASARRRQNPRLGRHRLPALFRPLLCARCSEGERAAVDELAAAIADRPAPRRRPRPARASATIASTPTGRWATCYDVNLEDDLETLLMIPDRSPAVVADVMERCGPIP
jgi:hypothetical protein